jgi:tRNA threonylcarbamoyladenosine biosynthesis protein TsaE
MGGRNRIVSLSSSEKTFFFGKYLANLMKPNSILALSGDLGSGKTSLVQGLAAGLGIDTPIQSPTFTYLNLYEEGTLPLYHFDLYRMQNEKDFFSMGFEEYFERGGVTAIEWPERLGDFLPAHTLSLHFSYLGRERSISFPSPFDPELLEFLDAWD